MKSKAYFFLFLIFFVALVLQGQTAFTNTGSLNTARQNHTATLLPNGQVLVAGGWNSGGYLASCEIYNPSNGTWEATGSLSNSRAYHTATLLPNGQVLVAGGIGLNGVNINIQLAICEIYNPETGTWTTTGNLANAREQHTATLLPNGQVLVAGGAGINNNPLTCSLLASCELYNPATGTWAYTGDLGSAHYYHTATLLTNGQVLVIGGSTCPNWGAGCELYNPSNGTWAFTGNLANAPRPEHTATLLPNGQVLVAGGRGTSGVLTSTELYNQLNGTWGGTGDLGNGRQEHTATLLPNGQVLVVGGYGNSGPLASAELYSPSNGTWATTGSLTNSRAYHTATLLPNGQVLVAGGIGGGDLASCELCYFIPPALTTQPLSQTNYAGANVTFSVSATSQWLLSFQWQKNGTNLTDGSNIFGSASNTLTIANISDGDAASYSVVVSNFTGTVTSSNASLTVNDSPFLFQQPVTQTIGVGSDVTFSAAAFGAPPFVFQWYLNGSPVGSPATGTNVSFYTLANVQTNNSGIYSVRVFNGYNSATSSNATLTVTSFPPSITTQPSSQSVLLGRSALFTVSVSGTPPFQYQWQFNGSNILSATNAAYTISPCVASNTGTYSAVITNLAGSITSSNAILTVIVPPTMTLQFLSGYPLLSLTGMLGYNFTVQYSTNLASTNWIFLLSVPNLSANPYQFIDSAGIVPPARFYRTIQLQ